MTGDFADRLAILDGLRRYAYGIDDRDFAAVRGVFADDAILDYQASGGPKGLRDEVVAWIEQGLAQVGASQHVLANEVVDLDGDTATSRCLLFNPLLLAAGTDAPMFLIGGEYRDRWRRGEDGAWEIVERVHVVSWRRSLR